MPCSRRRGPDTTSGCSPRPGCRPSPTRARRWSPRPTPPAITVVAHPGASSIALALAASGLNGQSFAFVGYIPVPAEERAARIRALEAASRRDAQTQILIETPYRNVALLEALLAQLQPTTRLSVSVGLTLPGGFTRSGSVAQWRQRPTPLPADVPAVFALLAGR